jgi:hypothetical protein
MSDQSYVTSFTVDQSPEEIFSAINNVRGWWSEEIEGRTDHLGAEFEFHHQDLHHTTQKITEWVPDKKVVWQVVASRINFVKDKNEWKATHIVFEITRTGSRTELRFTHLGLVPACECYGNFSGAWGFHINDSLRRLIASGKASPTRKNRWRIAVFPQPEGVIMQTLENHGILITCGNRGLRAPQRREHRSVPGRIRQHARSYDYGEHAATLLTNPKYENGVAFGIRGATGILPLDT